MNKIKTKVVNFLFMMFTTMSLSPITAYAKDIASNLTYKFTGDNPSKPGYAQGIITLSSKVRGTYYLYWADSIAALDGYYPITKLTIQKENDSATFTFDYHTAIPANATKIIAIKVDNAEIEPTDAKVTNAAYVYDIPASKQLKYKASDALYTFNSYSDIHIDEEHYGSTPSYGFYKYAEKHWADALKYSKDKKVDFVITSGDNITNAAGPSNEWLVYEKILADSDYTNPIWESSGNHEIRTGDLNTCLKAFIKASGLNGTPEGISNGKAYYTVTEPKTGDIFVFMCLENSYRVNLCEEISDEQLAWLENILKDNWNKGFNIYVIQHSLISGYGVGDSTTEPYYDGSMQMKFECTKKFKSIIEKYPNIIWISGHSHEDYSMGHNYSNENGTSCNMIHNSSVGGPTHPSTSTHSLDYSFDEKLSQGYYVQAFADEIIFSGANLCDQKIYPSYCYIIEGSYTPENSSSAVTDNNVKTLNITTKTLNEFIAKLSEVKTILRDKFEFSSYYQYQGLKKIYYEYKDAEFTKLSQDEINSVYAKLDYCIKEFDDIYINVSK